MSRNERQGPLRLSRNTNEIPPSETPATQAILSLCEYVENDVTRLLSKYWKSRDNIKCFISNNCRRPPGTGLCFSSSCCGKYTHAIVGSLDAI